MKKRAVLILFLALSLCAAPAVFPSASFSARAEEAVSGQAEEKSLYQRGMDIVALLADMAHNPAFLEVYGVPQSVAPVVERISQGDYSQPSRVYRLTPQSSLSGLIGQLAGSWGQLPDSVADYLESQTLSLLRTLTLGREGLEQNVVMATFSADKLFVSRELSQDMFYLYMFENGCPVLVSFQGGEDGAVSAQGTFLLNEGLASGETSVQSFFSLEGIYLCRVELLTD